MRTTLVLVGGAGFVAVWNAFGPEWAVVLALFMLVMISTNELVAHLQEQTDRDTAHRRWDEWDA